MQPSTITEREQQEGIKRQDVRERIWALYNIGFNVGEETLERIDEPALHHSKIHYTTHEIALTHSGIDPQHTHIDDEPPCLPDLVMINRYQLTGDTAYAHKVALNNYGLIIYASLKMQRMQSIPRKGYFELGDLINEAYLHFFNCMGSFNSTKGFAISTYITKSIYNVLNKSRRDAKSTIRMPSEQVSRISRLIREIEGDELGLVERAREKLGEQSAQWLYLYLHGVQSLDAMRGEKNDYNDYERLGVEDASLRSVTPQIIVRNSIDELAPNERELIKRKYGIDGSEETQVSRIGQENGKTKAWASKRIIQIENKLEKIIRERMERLEMCNVY